LQERQKIREIASRTWQWVIRLLHVDHTAIWLRKGEQMIFFTAHTDGGGLMVPFYGVPRIPAPRITTLAILSHLTRTTIGTVTC
jgi:hypothetical protein